MVPVIRVVLVPAGHKWRRLILLDFQSKKFWVLYPLFVCHFSFSKTTVTLF